MHEERLTKTRCAIPYNADGKHDTQGFNLHTEGKRMLRALWQTWRLLPTLLPAGEPWKRCLSCINMFVLTLTSRPEVCQGRRFAMRCALTFFSDWGEYAKKKHAHICGHLCGLSGPHPPPLPHAGEGEPATGNDVAASRPHGSVAASLRALRSRAQDEVGWVWSRWWATLHPLPHRSPGNNKLRAIVGELLPDNLKNSQNLIFFISFCGVCKQSAAG